MQFDTTWQFLKEIWPIVIGALTLAWFVWKIVDRVQAVVRGELKTMEKQIEQQFDREREARNTGDETLHKRVDRQADMIRDTRENYVKASELSRIEDRLEALAAATTERLDKLLAETRRRNGSSA